MFWIDKTDVIFVAEDQNRLLITKIQMMTKKTNGRGEVIQTIPQTIRRIGHTAKMFRFSKHAKQQLRRRQSSHNPLILAQSDGHSMARTAETSSRSILRSKVATLRRCGYSREKRRRYAVEPPNFEPIRAQSSFTQTSTT
jgi:hypothetical protein